MSPGEAGLVVEARGLVRTYDTAAGPLRVLDGVDLAVPRGATVSIAGESGCGKSTLLSLLAGLDAPSGGALVVGGADLASADEASLADFRARTVGIVFQHFHLLRSMTALENVRLPLELRDGRDREGRAEALLDAVGLGARRDHFPSQMSGGECQRVAIARALVTRPALLLADEPTGNLDEKTGRAVADLLFELVEGTGATMVLVTHSRALAARCGRSLRLEGGRLHAGGAAAEFVDEERANGHGGLRGA